jgi:hypothetical protein
MCVTLGSSTRDCLGFRQKKGWLGCWNDVQMILLLPRVSMLHEDVWQSAQRTRQCQRGDAAAIHSRFSANSQEAESSVFCKAQPSQVGFSR